MKTVNIKNIILTEQELLDLVKEHPTHSALGEKLGVHRATVAKAIKAAYPDMRPKAKLYVALLECMGKRLCSSCHEVHELENFYRCATTPSGYGTQCKDCAKTLAKNHYNPELSSKRTKMWNRENRGRKNYLTRSREEVVRQRTPLWADKEKIENIYQNCPEGHHVDHIVPLQGEKVSGLHVETNLQYLLAEDNLKKSNKGST